MALLLGLCVAVLCLAIVYLVQQSLRPRKFPPGPTWLPVVGNVFYINSLVKQLRYHHVVFSHLAQQYHTDILGLKLGQDLTVVVNSLPLIQEVLLKDEFQGRPISFFFQLRTMGSGQGITCADGESWHKQRAFAVRHLRKFGYGKEGMERAIQEELSDMLIELKKYRRVHLGPFFAKIVLNVLWTMVAGTRMSQSCSYIDKLLLLMDKRKRLFDMSGGKLSHMPWLRFIAPDKCGYNLITRINEALQKFFMEIIVKHMETHMCHDIRDFIDAYLHQMHVEIGDDFTVNQLIVVCLDFFIAGSQTTSNTLDFAFLLMLLHPHVQQKVRDEIWSVVGSDRKPALRDRTNMPYVEAVLMETQRLCTIVPLTGPRRVLKDTTLGGYNIPKDTIVLLNTYDVHMSEEHWKDPHTFRPERFLDDNGDLKFDEWFLPFGIGRRRCLGESLARSCIFLLFTGLLQRYEVLPDNTMEFPTLKLQPGMTMSPEPYRALLERIYEDPENDRHSNQFSSEDKMKDFLARLYQTLQSSRENNKKLSQEDG